MTNEKWYKLNVWKKIMKITQIINNFRLTIMSEN